jgi:hypothetical protein
MTRNLETADKLAKLTLAASTVVLYFFKLIRGPFAEALLLLSVTVIGIYLIKLVTHSQED